MSDHLFNIFKLNKYFAISSIVLLGCVLLMVKKDYDREWKQWQRKFQAMEIERTQADLAKASEELAKKPEYLSAKEALRAATTELQKNEVHLFQLEKKMREVEGKRYAANTKYQADKADLDALRYKLEEAEAHHQPGAVALRKKYSLLSVKVRQQAALLDQADRLLSSNRAEIEAQRQAKVDAEAALKKQTEALDRLELRYSKIRRRPLEDAVRDAPLLDFIDPTVRVKEIVVPDLYSDYNFAKVPRADACKTCHVAIDKPGYENEANPLKTHPSLDVMLSTNSPHPIESFGCTVCHLGLGGGLTFTSAAHTPQNEEQAGEWKKKYGWHRVHDWAEPMITLPHTEATCYGCHQSGVEVPKGEKINAGIAMVEHYGCYGCHKIEGWENVRKSGPSLTRVASKVTETWMTKWIRNPKAFRPTTNMPAFFDQPNSDDPVSKRRSAVEVVGIVKYLRSKSQPYAPAVLDLPTGDSSRGKALFGSVGCLGCHSIDDFPNPQPKGFRPAPDLSGIGSKVSREWLVAWLKDPKQYWPETKMPSLRLTSQEISDLSAYLATRKAGAFDDTPPQAADRVMTDQVVLSHLKKKMTDPEAMAKRRSMSLEEKQVYIGERAIVHYGCFGCHLIPGFEDAKPIGTELTFEASKSISRLDFALIETEHTVENFIYQKLLNPRIFDQGKIKDPLEKLKMPNFGFTSEEAKTVLNFVLGLRKYATPPHRKLLPTARNSALADGRRAVHDLNCRGCHTIEGQGGEILSFYEDKSSGPPNLISEGSKVQQDWLYHFLQDPTPIRPWLSVRMPTFALDEKKTNTLIRYFRAIDKLLPEIEPRPAVNAPAETVAFGNEVFTQFRCLSCHVVDKIPEGQELSNLAPNMKIVAGRIRPDWFNDWLRDPQKLLPGTRMPNFFYYEGEAMFPDADKRIDALNAYVYQMK